MAFSSFVLSVVHLSCFAFGWDWPWTSDIQRFVNHVSTWTYEHGTLHCEVHQKIRTDDGYLLTAFRLRPQKGAHGTPIMLQHGFLDSAWGFVLLHDNIARFLWNQGYDVWLTNSRGNTYSRKHVKYSVHDDRFWKFSMPEFALYDLPANLQYISKVTGYERFPYVGHSQGTTQMIIASSDWNGKKTSKRHGIQRRNHVKKIVRKRVAHFIALSPVFYIGETDCIPCKLLAKAGFIDAYSQVSEKGMLFGYRTLQRMMTFACSLPGLSMICSVTAEMIIGRSEFDQPHLLDEWFKNFPAGTSVRDCQMWSQWLLSGQMETEIGHSTSFVESGTLSVPTTLFWGTNDNFASTPDRIRAQQSLSMNNNIARSIYFEGFSHGTWQIGDRSAQEKINHALCSVLKCKKKGTATDLAAQVLDSAPLLRQSEQDAPEKTLASYISESELDKTKLDETTLDETTLDETKLNESDLGETELDEIKLDETEIGESAIDLSPNSLTDENDHKNFVDAVAEFAASQDGTGEGRRFMA